MKFSKADIDSIRPFSLFHREQFVMDKTDQFLKQNFFHKHTSLQMVTVNVKSSEFYHRKQYISFLPSDTE